MPRKTRRFNRSRNATVIRPIRVQLPPEMTDAIIDHLCNNKQALAACSLVCKSWSPRARRHLFGHTQIVVHPMNSRKFMKSGMSRNLFVCQLHVATDLPWPSWAKLLRPLVGANFDHIQSLSLTSQTQYILTNQELSTIIDLFSRVTYLKIYRLYTCHFSDYLRFICAFRHLETLVIDHPFWERRDSDFSLSTLRLPSTLRALELKDNGEHIIMEWLLTLETLPPLRTLYQHEIFEPEGVRLLGKLLTTLGPSLEAVSYTYCGTENPETVNLSCNTSLRSIRLGIFTIDEGTTEWITETLSQIISVHMVKVNFRMTYRSYQPPSLLEWHKVDAVLARACYSKLQKVKINLFRWGGGNVDTFPAPDLPICRARGIFDVCEIGREDMCTSYLTGQAQCEGSSVATVV